MEAPLIEFYDEHFPAVYRFVLCRTRGDHAEAEEIVGDVFYQAFRDIEGYDAEHPPGPWLLGIARHRTTDALRRKGRRSDLTGSFTPTPEEGDEAFFDLEAADLPESALEREEVARLVEWVLSELPPEYGRILRLRYVDELPVTEGARATSLTPKAAEAKLFRARNGFRDAFRRAARGLDIEGPGVSQ